MAQDYAAAGHSVLADLVTRWDIHISTNIYTHIYTYLNIYTYLHNPVVTLQIYLDPGILSMMSGEDPGRLGWREQLAPLQEER